MKRDNYKKLFQEFQSVINKPFGKEFVDFIKDRSINELIYLFLKCKNIELTPPSQTDKMTFERLENTLKKNKKLSVIDQRNYNELLFKFSESGIKEPERARMLLNAELNRRMQNRAIIFSVIPAGIAIILSIITIVINCNKNDNLEKLLINTCIDQKKLESEIKTINSKLNNQSIKIDNLTKRKNKQ